MVKTMKRDELVALIRSSEKFKLVDVLPKESYRKEHIKGAISLPLDEIDTRAKDILNKDEKIVVYCASFDCMASTKAAERLQALGYKNVLDYKGGLKDYKEGNLPLEGKTCEETAKAKAGCCSCG